MVRKRIIKFKIADEITQFITEENKKLVNKMKKELGLEGLQYYIDFGEGEIKIVVDGSFKDVMEVVLEQLKQTQQNVTVYEFWNGFIDDEVARLPWHAGAPAESDIVIKRFGDFGFYADWILKT